eukprot:maker-scaffold_24-snap-gene-2.2-mRNA-1 protein AED:0.06 eAED:0.06 QI:93/1/1/1/0.5/0.33/3/62/243
MEEGGNHNVVVLSLAAVTFIGFAIAEMVASFSSNSLSLFGDAATMIVDAMTYGFNMYAEWRKSSEEISLETSSQLEIYSPLFSVCILYILCCYVIYDSWLTLSKADTDTPDVNEGTMFIFSIVNLVIDVVNIFAFYFANNKKDNANMCSALTHVAGDTLRSLAVLGAAFYAKEENVNSAKADAYAAIFVSLVIFGTSVPLIQLLKEKFKLLSELRKEKESEGKDLEENLLDNERDDSIEVEDE